MYVLKAMEKKTFRTWRNQRLLKMKEQNEATINEAEAITIFAASVQSEDDIVDLETDSKPRTVFF